MKLDFIKLGIGMVLALCCWMCLSIFPDRMPYIFKVGCSFICLIRGVKWDDINENIYCSWLKDVPGSIARILLALYLAWAFGGVYVLDHVDEFKFWGGKFLYSVLSIVYAIAAVDTSIWLLTKDRSIKERNIKNRLPVFLIFFIPGLLVSLLCLYAWNPAITSYDSYYIYDLALRIGTSSFTMTDWQPPGYVFFVGLLLKICNNVTFVVIVQIVFYWAVLTGSILYFYKIGAPKWLLGAAYGYMLFSYSNQIQLATFWKDIPYATAILLLTVLLVECTLEWSEFNRSIRLYVLLYICLMIVSLFRQNGILATAALIVLLPVLYRDRRMVILSMASIVTLFFIKGWLFNYYHVVPQPSLKYYAMANDIFNANLGLENKDSETNRLIGLIREADPDESLLSRNVFYTMYTHADLSEYSIPEFIRIYLNNLIKHPGEMARIILRRTEIIWSVTGCEAEIISCVDYIGEEQTMEPSLYPKRINNKITDVFESVHTWLRQKSSRIYVFFWRPGIYHIIILISFVAVLSKRKEALLPFIPIVFNVVALFLSSGWPDYRYYWPGVQVCWTLVAYCLLLHMSKQRVEGKMEWS